VPSAVRTYRADRVDLDPPSRPAPARVRVASVDIDLPVVDVGVEASGAMELPTTVQEAGWYEFGSRPGDSSGTTVLAAHVDTRREGLGPFARLREVRDGATVVVEDSAGRGFSYRVTARERIAKPSVPLAEIFSRDGPPRLVLLTCGGAYDQGTGYRDNVVVTAVPET